jgi:uncharacterized protein
MQGEGLEDTLTSGKISSILQEYLEPDFAAKDYSAGAEKVYGAFIQELGGQWKDDTQTSEETSDEKANTTTNQYTYDEANILSNESEQNIQNKSSKSQELYGAGFYVATKDKCEAGLSFQEDAINTFEEINAGSRDALLVLYKEDDNYWLLPGKEAEEFAAEDVLRDILDNALEPNFANKEYSMGAKETAEQLYELFQTNYKKMEGTSSTNIESISKKTEKIYPMIFVLLLLVVLFILTSRRKHYRNVYGVPFNPYAPRYIRHYGPEGYWGRHGQPPMRNGNWNGRINTQHGYNDNNGAGRSSESESWGSNGGAGRSSESESWGSNGGAGRSSGSKSWGNNAGSNSSSSRSMFSGGGGMSRGGGAGRSSSSAGRSSSSAGRSFSSAGRSSSSAGRSSGGRSSSGGGGTSRGGGAGRK